MDVNKAFKLMHKNRKDNKKKGDAGEEISLALAQQYTKDRDDCTILHSYKYPYYIDPSGEVLSGNIKYENGEYHTIQRAGFEDEVDLIIITAYRIFAIEVKARSGKWHIFDHWSKQGGKMVDKAPVAQAEKHARHLYATVHEYLPDGDPKYIIPVVVYVDKSEIKDTRSKEFKNYVHVCNANTFIKKLKMLENPLKYNIDSKELIEHMLEVGDATVYK